MNDLSLFAQNPLANTDFPFLISNKNNRLKFPYRFVCEAIHWHNDLQFIYVIKGSIVIQTLKEKIEIHQNNAIYISPKTIHSISNSSTSEYISYIFPATLLVSSNEQLHKKYVTDIISSDCSNVTIFDSNSSVCSCVKKLYDYLSSHKHSQCYEIDILSLLHNIWSAYILSNKQPVKPMTRIDKLRSERLEQAFSFIHTHYFESISIEDIAHSCYISKTELLRLFRSSMNISPYEYLIDFRIKKSIDLLDNSTLSIAEISSKVGYNSQSQFGKHFKQRLDISPNSYRYL